MTIERKQNSNRTLPPHEYDQMSEENGQSEFENLVC